MGARQLGNSTRYSDYGFEQVIRGLTGRGVWEFDGAVKQTVVAGAEYKHTETARPRDSLTVEQPDRRRQQNLCGQHLSEQNLPRQQTQNRQPVRARQPDLRQQHRPDPCPAL